MTQRKRRGASTACGRRGHYHVPRSGADKILSWPELLRQRKLWRKRGETVVWTNGCFDLIHVGHILSLQQARQQGDILVVGLNSDTAIRRIKGPDRPVVRAPERLQIIAALEAVDYVILFNEDTPEHALSRLKPDVHCKGADYAPPNGKPIPEAKVVNSYGGRIVFLPMISLRSTTNLIQRIRKQA
ncbi:MAG: adenylyltransferase/cytidyltransferase family protein [bacterium]